MSAPLITTLIDDFNRANGSPAAGAGAAIWSTHDAGTAAATPCVISANQLKGGGGWRYCVSSIEMESDCDILVDITAVGSGMGFMFGATKTDQADWQGGTIGFSGGSWYWSEIVAGVGQAMGQSASSAPVVGETYWVEKRGTMISLYKSPDGITFTLIGGFNMTLLGAGAFGFQFADAAGQLDNLRGGPVIAPSYSILIDDFNRADGVVNAGAGAAIWADHAIAVSSAPTVVIQGNRIGPSSGWASALLKQDISEDFDMMIDCVVTPSGDGSISFWMCGTKMGQGDYCAFVVAWDPSGNGWQAISYTDGSGQMILGTPVSTSPPVAGKTYWVSKRSLTVKLYEGSSSTGPWKFLSSFAVPPARSVSGMFGFQFAGNTITHRWDNLRGGPVYIPPPPPARSILIKTSTGWQDLTVTPTYDKVFPSDPIDGQEHVLVDDLVNPTYQWRFRYNETSSSPYKWEFIGGAPLLIQAGIGVYDTVVTANTWTLLAHQLKYTVPISGDWYALTGASCGGGSGGDFADLSIGNNAVVPNPLIVTASQFGGSGFWGMSVPARLTVAAAGGYLAPVYRGSSVGIKFQNRWIQVQPVRVG